eukprot:2142708-Prymnesium_polylepis.1
MRDAALLWWRSGGVAVETSLEYGTGVGLGRALALSGRRRAATFLHGKVQCRSTQQEVAELIDRHLDELGVASFDLLTVHYPEGRPARSIPSCGGASLGETWRAFEAAVAAGKARAIGVSSFSPEWLWRLLELGSTKPAYNQYRMEVGASPPELGAVLELCALHNITVGGFGVLSSGCPALPAVQGIAAAHGKTAAQVCQRWVTQQGCNAVVASTREKYDAEDLAATAFDLDADEMALLTKQPIA